MTELVKQIAPNPFPPKSGMGPKVFLGRDDAIVIFERSLKRATQGYLDHFTILGDWGVGKTTLEIVEEIFQYSEGHPFQLQVICDNLYDNQINGEVNLNALDVALENTLHYLGEIVLENLYDKASEREKFILSRMVPEYRVHSIDDLIVDSLVDIKRNEVRTFLLRLTKKGITKKVSRGEYAISSRMLSEYISRK